MSKFSDLCGHESCSLSCLEEGHTAAGGEFGHTYPSPPGDSFVVMTFGTVLLASSGLSPEVLNSL